MSLDSPPDSPPDSPADGSLSAETMHGGCGMTNCLTLAIGLLVGAWAAQQAAAAWGWWAAPPVFLVATWIGTWVPGMPLGMLLGFLMFFGCHLGIRLGERVTALAGRVSRGLRRD